MARKGRSLEELGLVSAPVAPVVERAERLQAQEKTKLDPRLAEEAWAKSRKFPLELFLSAIDRMRGDGRWDWCDETLTGIYDRVYANQDYSLNMKIAVDNLYTKVAKHYEADFDEFVKER